MVRRLFLRPVAVLLGAVCLINGCFQYQWKQEPVSATLRNERPPAAARIRMVDGRQFIITQPRVTGDSLVGRIDSLEPGPASLPRRTVSTPVSVALAGVRSVETRRVDAAMTAGVTLAWTLGAILGLDILCRYSGCFVWRQ